jgi:hypothetical protein
MMDNDQTTTQSSTRRERQQQMKKKIIGYVLLHRHGHRAPEKNIFLNSSSEVDLWSSLMPKNTFLEEMAELYPVVTHPRNPTPPYDVTTRPFGCITDTGVKHLRSVGQRARSNFVELQQLSNVAVYSTNYQRTQVDINSSEISTDNCISFCF